jgi:hypothetical protein
MRILPAATVLAIGTVAFLALAVPRFFTGYDEWQVRQELQRATPGDTLDRLAARSLADGDVSGALQYASLAETLGKPLSPETRQALEEAQGTWATFLRNAGDFAGAYVTGHADSAAGLAGAVVSDLTVVGDVRDIVSEGGKAAMGEEYSRFLLTLAAIGLAAEGATIATGGTSLLVQAAISVLKVAKRTGNLTAEFTNRLVRLADAAARGPVEVASVPRAGRTAVDDVAAAPLTRAAARAELRTTLGAIGAAADNAGPANTVRLLRTVRTTEDARELATFTSRFGPNSRAVAELTGKTSLRAFRVSVRGLRLLWMFLWSLLAWIAGLVALRIVRGLLSGLVQLARGAVVAVAVPSR